ncbi:MAG: AmmeMemoRadiSam system radical SAM enzyme [Lachnospiraceae bacterium]|nr:AmmeMemoRadiSam system radical SAM enzyme [Lachnospiraceae bacterium]
MAVCNVCFRHCSINDGELGFCRARSSKDGHVYPINYSRITSLALDPIEKKPLNRFYPGSRILSVGSFGCNLRCPFCQNSEISWDDQVDRWQKQAESLSPKELADIAKECVSRGNIGVAFTYNEPLIGYEYVRDTAKLIHDMGMKNVLVTNGTATKEVYDKLADYIDAMNIDLKGFNEHYYRDVLKGDLDMVLEMIGSAVKRCHVELTTLIIPGENDSEEEMRQISTWISELKDANGNTIGQNIPLHISRFFPCFHMTDRDATDVSKVYRLADVAREKLKYVYTGNC